jgi:hypothetical protein
MIDSIWKFSPGWGILPLTLGYEKVLFPLQAPARIVEPRGPSNEAQNKQSHEAQSDLTRCYIAQASFPPSNYLNIILSP